MHAKSKRYTGFTLAEVLITLGIIGVVAAFTIPTLMKNTQDAEFKSAWKKQYSTFANATQTVLNDNGGNISGLITGNDDTMRALYKPYLNVATPCPKSVTVKGTCWHPDNTWYLLNGTPTPDATVPGFNVLLYPDPAGDILADGTLVRYLTTDCSAQPYCGYILVDVNGFRKPNTVGRDIYGMYLYTTKLVPVGTNTKGEGTTCNPTDNGFACSAKYLYN